jgi:hypothetical protein
VRFRLLFSVVGLARAHTLHFCQPLSLLLRNLSNVIIVLYRDCTLESLDGERHGQILIEVAFLIVAQICDLNRLLAGISVRLVGGQVESGPGLATADRQRPVGLEAVFVENLR